MLTKEQIIANIEALDKQGASQQEIQGWLDSLKTTIQQPVQPIKSQPPKAIQNLADIGFGALKGAGSTLTGMGEIPLKLASKIPAFRQEAQQGLQTAKSLKKGILVPTNTAQAIGKEAEQIAEMFIPVGGVAKGAGLLKKSLVSATEFAGKTALQTGGDIKKSVGAGLIAGAIPGASGLLKATGKKLAETVIPFSAREAQLVQSYKAAKPLWQRVMAGIEGKSAGVPITAGKTAFKKGIMGTESMIGVQAKRGATNLWSNLISPQLKKSNIKQDLNSFWDEIGKKIINENPELNRQQSLLEALRALKEPYSSIKSVPLEELQKLKEGWAKFVPEKAYRGKPIAGSFNEVKNMAARIAGDKIRGSLGKEIGQAYFDYGNLKALQELGQKAMTGGKLKGGFGGFWNAIKDMALIPVGTIGGQVIYKTGIGLELVGRQGAKKITDIIPDPNE